jgi:hypothetical protein
MRWNLELSVLRMFGINPNTNYTNTNYTYTNYSYTNYTYTNCFNNFLSFIRI